MTSRNAAADSLQSRMDPAWTTTSQMRTPQQPLSGTTRRTTTKAIVAAAKTTSQTRVDLRRDTAGVF